MFAIPSEMQIPRKCIQREYKYAMLVWYLHVGEAVSLHYPILALLRTINIYHVINSEASELPRINIS